MASGSAFMAGIAVVGGPFLAAGLIGAICLTVMSVINISIFFQLAWLWIAFSGLIVNSLGITENIGIQYLDEFFLAVMTIHLLIRLKRLRGSNFLILTASFALIFIAVLSAVINRSPGSALISFLSAHIRIFILIICAQCLLTNSELKKIISTILFTGVFQFIIAVVQFSTFGSYNVFVGREIAMIQDAACGTFGYYGAHELGHFMIILVVLCSSLALFTRQLKCLILTIIFLATFLLSFTELDYLFLFCYLIVFCFQRNIKARYRLFCFALIAISAILFINYQANSQGRFFQYVTDKHTIVNSGKVQSLYLMKGLLLRDVANLAIGLGPGTFCSSSAFKHRGEYFRKYVEDKSEEVKSTIDYRWSSFMAIIAETGFISFLIYIFLFGYFFKKAVSIITQKGQDSFNKGIGSAYCFILIFFVYTIFLLNSFEMMGLTFPIAMVTAYVLKISQELAVSRA